MRFGYTDIHKDIPMQPIIKSYPVRDLQRNYRGILDEAKRSHDAILLIKDSATEAVVLDVETYNALISDHGSWDEAHTLKLVSQAQKSYKAGKAKKLVNWDDLDK